MINANNFTKKDRREAPNDSKAHNVRLKSETRRENAKESQKNRQAMRAKENKQREKKKCLKSDCRDATNSIPFCSTSICHGIDESHGINNTTSTYFSISNRKNRQNEYVISWNAIQKTTLNFYFSLHFFSLAGDFLLAHSCRELGAIEWPLHTILQHQFLVFFPRIRLPHVWFLCVCSIYRVWESLAQHRLHCWSCHCLDCYCTYWRDVAIENHEPLIPLPVWKWHCRWWRYFVVQLLA